MKLENRYAQFWLGASLALVVLTAFGFLCLVYIAVDLREFAKHYLHSYWFPVMAGGVFGGLLYGLREKRLVLPRTDGNNELVFGWITDCAYGLGGGFVVFLLLPGNFGSNSSTVDDWQVMKLFATALIGGYGGRAVIDKMLNQTLQDALKKADNAVEGVQQVQQRMDATEERANADAKAIALLYRQLDESGNAEPDRKALFEALQNASPSIQAQALGMAERLRRLNWRMPQTKPIMERCMPVFEALLGTAAIREKHLPYGQLGFALKDKRAPDFKAAEAMLSRAIELREEIGDSGWAFYEFNRAYCRIVMLGKDQPVKPEWEAEILRDLAIAAKAGLLNLIIADPVFGKWLSDHQVSEKKLLGKE